MQPRHETPAGSEELAGGEALLETVFGQLHDAGVHIIAVDLVSDAETSVVDVSDRPPQEV